MNTSSEYAPQYTARERTKLVLFAVVFGGAFILLWNVWALPRWTAFAQKAPCVQFGGISGSAWLFYGIFVGLPLLSALVVALTLGRRGARILREGQVPCQGEKVFRPTKIQRGSKATKTGWVHVLAALPFVAIAIWGVFQAEHWVNDSAGRPRTSKCEENAR